MLRLKIERARVKVKSAFWGGGSVKAETVQTSCTGMEVKLEIDSQEEPEKIGKLSRLAEAGCYVMQTIRNPTPVSLKVALNGQELQG